MEDMVQEVKVVVATMGQVLAKVVAKYTTLTQQETLRALVEGYQPVWALDLLHRNLLG